MENYHSIKVYYEELYLPFIFKHAITVVGEGGELGWGQFSCTTGFLVHKVI